MLYSALITIPKRTQPETPYSYILPLTTGHLTDTFIAFRSGNGYVCGIQILLSNIQRFPYNTGEWIISNREMLHFHDTVDLNDIPAYATIKGYNLSYNNDHRVWIALLVERVDIPERLASFIQFVSRRER
jgi:hypothetical protein